jgi:transposase
MRRKHKDESKATRSLAMIEPNAAGIDVGASEHYVAVPADRDDEPVRNFSAYTRGLRDLADWLATCGITTVAMESTGVYWVPLYELLEERGIEVCLVNARHVKNVPGRKTDVLDCQWLQQLHSYGLLRASFRPGASFVKLRTFLRHRESLMKNASTHVQHMQKALSLMNVQLHRAIADITGLTGMAIIRHIVAGQHDPEVLAEHRDRRCRASREEIVEALRGKYCAENLFVLQQALELYDTYQHKIAACDTAIEAQLDEMRRDVAHVDLTPLPESATKRKKRRSKEFLPDIRETLYAITLGVDLTEAAGLAELTTLQIIAEIGTDMSPWPTAKHFVSWTTLAPSARITGGKRFKSRRPSTANRIAQILRLAAVNAGRTQTAIGAFFRRLAARVGRGKAVVATAAKLARIIYTMLNKKVPFSDPGPDAYAQRYRDRLLRNLKRRAAELGHVLVPETSEEEAPA